MEQNNTKREMKEQRQKDAEFRSKAKIVFGVLLILVVFGGLTWLSVTGSQKKEVVTNDLLTVVADDHVKGMEKAPVTLIEYLDFECEACGAYYPILKQLATEFPNDLRIVMRYFPLPGHKNSFTAALAVEAASKQGKYAEMHDILFENQETWGNKQIPTPEVFEEYAKQIGLDVEKFKADVANPLTRERVQRDFNASGKLGNNSTPSFFMNGKKIDSPRGYEPFKALIQTEKEKATSGQ